MYWYRSNRFDKEALPLADRHYNRQKPGSPQFVPPGSCLVLLGENRDALWVTLIQRYQDHAWPGAWVNSLFRNESNNLSSVLIRQALSASVFFYGEPPQNGLITFIDASKVFKKNKPGWCYRKAGFKHVGFTGKGLYVLQILPADFPAPESFLERA